MTKNFDTSFEKRPSAHLWRRLRELGLLDCRATYENRQRTVHIDVPESCPSWIDIEIASKQENVELWPIGMVYDQVELALLCDESERVFLWYHDDQSFSVTYCASSVAEALVQLLGTSDYSDLRISHEEPWAFVRSDFRG